MKILRYAILFSILFCSTQLYAQTSTDFSAMAKQGKQLQRAGKYSDALKVFERGRALANRVGDKEWMGKFLFYHGNTYILQAEQSRVRGRPQARRSRGSNSARRGGNSVYSSTASNGNGGFSSGSSDSKAELAQRAISVFKQVVEQLPESGSSKIKLASAYALAGLDDDANAWYQKAIDQNDDKQALYRMQYATFLEQRSPKRAIKQLQTVIAAQPNNTKAHQQLIQIYRQPEYARSFVKYLHQQIASGQVIRAQDATLAALLNSDWSEKSKSKLMPALALSLSKQHIDSEQYRESKTAEVLKNIANTEPTLADCIKELNDTVASAKPVDYVWWSKDRKRASAISDLMRARAKYYDQRNQPELAKDLYIGAADLVGEKDPTAVMDLVDFYSKRGDLNGINNVSRKYEYELFRGKGDAYRNGNIEEIYDYHRTLASIYSFQAKKSGNWGSSSKANSATFQLERAYAAANGSKKIIPDTRLVKNLADSYDANRQTKKANNVRIDAAAMYKNNGKAAAATDVLKAVKVNKLNRAELKRYDRVRVSPVLSKPSVNTKPKHLGPVIFKPGGKPPVNKIGGKNVTAKPISTYKTTNTYNSKFKPIKNNKAVTNKQVSKPGNSSSADKASNTKAAIVNKGKIQSTTQINKTKLYRSKATSVKDEESDDK